MYYTFQQPLHLLENFSKRGAIGETEDPHHIDHMYSISQGFLNNVPPKTIGHFSNLQMLPAVKNITKGSSCSITLEDLYARLQNVAIN